jgi:predicted ArsR family transcriptional regulator
MDDLDRLGALGDPTRRTLFRIVTDAREPIGRDAAAAAAGISRSLAAFHLDRLVEAGLLTTEFRRLTGRTGPGAGRPSKLYRLATDGVQVSMPARRYDRMAAFLASGIDAAAAASEGSEEPARTAIDSAAARVGHAIGSVARAALGARPGRATARRAVVDALDGEGFSPTVEPSGTVLLANCPFDAVARDHRPTVCRANLALVDGLLDGFGSAAAMSASLEPDDHRCCVVLRPS